MSSRFLDGPLAPLAVFLLAVVLYAGTLFYGFVWDDMLILTHMTEAWENRGLAGLLSADYGYLGRAVGYWRPVTLLSMWLTWIPFPGSPLLPHLGNVLIHALCAACLLLLGRRLAGARAAFLAALLFALWPTHTESTAQVGNRHDLLACLFVLLAALAWAKDRAGRRPLLLAGGALSYLAAILSKESAFVLPAALVAWELVDAGAPRRWRETLRTRTGWLPAWGAAAAAAFALRLLAAGGSMGVRSEVSYVVDLWREPGLGLVVLFRELGLLALPWPVQVYYYPLDLPLTLSALGGSALLIAAVLGAAGPASGRLGLATAAWVAVFLLPVLGLVPIAGAVMAARYLTLASIGSCLLLGYWLDRFLGGDEASPRRRALAILGTGLLLASLAAATSVQNGFWRDNETLFRHIMRDTPSDPLGYNNLAVTLYRSERLAEAADVLRRSLARSPREKTYLFLAHLHHEMGDGTGELAVLLEGQGAFPASQAINDALSKVGESLSKVQSPKSKVVNP